MSVITVEMDESVIPLAVDMYESRDMAVGGHGRVVRFITEANVDIFLIHCCYGCPSDI